MWSVLRENFAQMNVYMRQMTYEEIEQQEAYDLTALFSTYTYSRSSNRQVLYEYNATPLCRSVYSVALTDNYISMLRGEGERSGGGGDRKSVI